MMAKKCFEPECMNEVGYACKYSSPDTLSCEVHAFEHINLPNRSHNLQAIFMQPCKGTNLLNCQISTVSKDLNSKPKETESTLNVIDTLRNKTAEILSRPNNPELEIDFRTTCSAIQKNLSLYDPPLKQACQYYLKAYQHKTSLYNTTRDYENSRTNLIIYNTETKTQEVKVFKTPELLDLSTCITQLPNGKLFCYGKYRVSGITVLIDVNGDVKTLPSGTHCADSSCIYFNNSVYCFGGNDENRCALTLSSRFDLNENRWIQLIPMPKADYYCNSIIFNGNILISGWKNRNILLYSIDIDSFSMIPYEFEEKKWKILINAESLYLIECPGSIYESKIGIYSNWRRIRKSKINCNISQVYCSYNKGGVYISTISLQTKQYYYFNLDQKIIIDVAYYNKHVALRRVDQKIEAIKWNNQNFKLDPYYLDEWNLKGNTLYNLGENLEVIEVNDEAIKLIPKSTCFYYNKANAYMKLKRYLEAIECYDEVIKLDPDYAIYYSNKGNAFNNLKRYPEAIECYDEAIKLKPKNASFYNDKGNTFYDLKRYLEAIEWYNKAIELNPNYTICYNNKGNAFNNLKKYLEAIECYEEAIKLDPTNADFHYNKGNALNELGRYPEALESYDEAIKINPYKAKYLNGKGNTLYALERYQEAMQCYDEAIKLKPNNPLHFCNRARVLNTLRTEEAALQDFNRAYNLKEEKSNKWCFLWGWMKPFWKRFQNY
ncbi:unnamed protein product [Blepharisma stoltei]|uniref:Tetratricopeptide repeat protein n=1 Tax=Blepharisma stoltei TaxID=1481888 RepID=A0AAU9IYE5_9CILI|nr:unnamed protein product [Blepharisma stoltei]